jgi:hypothetical protein
LRFLEADKVLAWTTAQQLFRKKTGTKEKIFFDCSLPGAHVNQKTFY